MNFDYIITDFKGLVHLVFSILSLITGSFVLGLKKGTKTHKKIGYVYSVSMIIVLATSFTMYNLFETMGNFSLGSSGKHCHISTGFNSNSNEETKEELHLSSF